LALALAPQTCELSWAEIWKGQQHWKQGPTGIKTSSRGGQRIGKWLGLAKQHSKIAGLTGEICGA
jgi:hypothetical protein